MRRLFGRLFIAACNIDAMSLYLAEITTEVGVYAHAAHSQSGIDHRRQAWNKLVDQPWGIMSIGLWDSAHGF